MSLFQLEHSAFRVYVCVCVFILRLRPNVLTDEIWNQPINALGTKMKRRICEDFLLSSRLKMVAGFLGLFRRCRQMP